MDIDNNTQEAEQWKKKYFDQLEESERREKQWKEAEDLLRKTVTRLTLAADGLDDRLDRQLRDLRDAIRDRAGTTQLRSRVDDMSSTLVKLDKERKSREPDSDEQPLLDLLNALSLPRGTGRQTKALKKQLSAMTKSGKQEAVESFAGLIHAALELSSGESPDVPAAASKAGLLKRLFGGEEKKHETDAATPAEPVQANEVREVRRPARQTISVRDILIRLLERLSLPDGLVDKLQAVRDQIECVGEGESWDRILQQIADLVQAVHTQTQREKQGIEDFLKQLSERLQDVDRQLLVSGQYYDESQQAGEQLDSAVKKEITGMETSVREAQELDQLKQMVQTHIDTVLIHLEKHREVEQERYEKAKAQVSALGDRLQDMESEAEHLRSKVHEERSQAMTDALTGIPNRLAYEERLEQEVARWKRFATPLVLVVWDVDNFKKVNDSFGHKAGDKVLRTIAQVLANGVRETDFVARYGGEEFVHLMTGSGLEDCLPVAEKLRAAIESTGFHFRDQSVTITASCGLAELSDGDSTEQWFERADKALYQAKEQGRNRCVSG